MKKAITPSPIPEEIIQNAIDTAQALIGRSTIALRHEHPQSQLKHPSTNIYIIENINYSIIWFSNIFNICDISIVQFNSSVDMQNCINICDATMEILKPNSWLNEDTIIQYYKEASSGQENLLVGWKYSCLLR